MEYKLKQHIQCKAKKIVPFGVFMYCPNGTDMLCHISNISNNYISDISNFITIGDIYDAEVVLDKSGKLSLSLKHLNLQDKSKSYETAHKSVRKACEHSTDVDDDNKSEIDKLIDAWKKDYKSQVGVGDPRQLGQKSKRRRRRNTK